MLSPSSLTKFISKIQLTLTVSRDGLIICQEFRFVNQTLSIDGNPCLVLKNLSEICNQDLFSNTVNIILRMDN
jgi:hypothetical protein